MPRVFLRKGLSEDSLSEFGSGHIEVCYGAGLGNRVGIDLNHKCDLFEF